MQSNNDNYYRQRALIESDNINVSPTNELKDIFILIGGIAVFIILFFLSFDFISEIIIDKIDVKTQMKIESLFNIGDKDKKIPLKYKPQIDYLNRVKRKIIEIDKSLENKSSLPISIIEDKNVNAMIYPNGKIYYTTGILDKKYTDQELAFVLAHEIGHYSNRDHLKTMSKQVVIILLCLLTGQDKTVNNIVSGISEMNMLSHSKEQEKKADKYASDILIRLYGTNEAGKTLLEKLEKEHKIPELMYYFSTHPSSKERIELLDSYN